MNAPSKRCCNLDWLEVYAIEPPGCNLDELYFFNKGYKVKGRAYGTPQYKEMFALLDDAGLPFVEIRRNPRSLRSEGGIFESGACSLRLSNRYCYAVNPIDDLRQFIIAHGYCYKSITRIDICLDFNEFDNGRTVPKFIDDFMKGRISKINQCNLAAHGKDNWGGRAWNSLKWGAQTSNVTTKIYNKTLEMREVGPKFYICDRWQEAGLDLTKDVWRIEFSIASQGQSLRNLKAGTVEKKTLLHYDSKEKVLQQWAIMAAKYFHFKTVVRNRNGNPQRKDRCPDLTTITIKDPAAEIYEPCRNITKDEKPTRTMKIMINALEMIARNDKEQTKVRIAALEVVAMLIERCRMVERKKHLQEIRNQIQDESMMKNERFALSVEQVQKVAKMNEEKERRLMRILMRKFGEVSVPKDCPF